MSKTNDFIETITEKLKHDRELRLDISHELQTHLDEAVEEYKASDYSDEDAIEAAIKDMGDAEQLTDDLWQANKSRMKLRAWCWWIARLTLWPASVLVTLAFMINGLSYFGVLRNPSWHDSREARNSPAAITKRLAEYRIRGKMSDVQRLIAFGDEQADSEIARWKALRDRFPDEPLYQLKYISTMYAACKKDQMPDKQAFFDALDRGRKLDPSNGVYDLIQADLLVRDIQYIQDKSQSLKFPLPKYSSRNQKDESSHPYVFEQPLSQALSQQVFSLLQSAVSHPYITLHKYDMLRHRVRQLPKAQSMQEYMFRIMGIQGDLLIGANSRRLALFVYASAMEQAKQGDHEKALKLVALSEHWQRKMAANTDDMLKLMYVRSIMSLNLMAKAFIHDMAGNQQAVEQINKQMAEAIREYEPMQRHGQMTDEMKERRKHSGAFLGILLEAVPLYEVDPTPFRLGEYAVLDRALLTVLLLSLILIGSLMMLGAVVRLCFARSATKRPLLLWVGWKRLAKVIGVSLGLPIGCFVVLSHTSLMGRQWGVDQNLIGLLWYLPVFVGAWGLLCYMGIGAIQNRASELGLNVPPRLSLWALFVFLCSAGAAMLMPFLMIRYSENFNHQRTDPRYMLIGLWVIEIAAFILVWLQTSYFVSWFRGIKDWFTQTMRSLAVGMGMMTLLLLLLSIVIALCAPWRDARVYIVVIVIVCLPVGFALSLMRLAGTANHYPQFMVSVTRTLPVFMMTSVLLLATVVGQALQWQERYYANTIADQSLILLDLEMQRTGAGALRDRWADGEPSPPSMIPND